MTTLDDVLAWLDDNKDDLVAMTRVRSRAQRYLTQAKKSGLVTAQPTALVVSTTKEIDPQAKEMALTLLKLVRQNYPWFRKNATPKQLSELLRKSAWHIEKINRVDGYDYPTIEAVIRWSQQDKFWKQNIKSGQKLRNKFEDLMSMVSDKYIGEAIEEV